MNERELLKSLEIFSHKLKNPLHAAGINLDVLKVKLKKQKVDKQTLQHLTIVDSEIKRVNQLVQIYFDYLKLSDKDKKKTDLKKLLEKK